MKPKLSRFWSYVNLLQSLTITGPGRLIVFIPYRVILSHIQCESRKATAKSSATDTKLAISSECIEIYLASESHVDVQQKGSGHFGSVRHQVISLLDESPRQIGEKPEEAGGRRHVVGLLEEGGDHEGEADCGESVEEEEDEDDRRIGMRDHFAVFRKFDSKQQSDQCHIQQHKKGTLDEPRRPVEPIGQALMGCFIC